ncbi:MAG: 30S ribosomal protein S4 [Deltaproteobacteria bacterium]|nr:30S ribosomal protein S4 [Deltaproteobacteria bacterium]
MARYKEAKCRLCRRENVKLFLKGERCYTDKCAMERRPYPPGQHGQARAKISEYGLQLREKQKMRRIYNVLEKQFRGYYHEATRKKGITGEQLIQLLERRLDNVVYRMGFANNRDEARQFIRHGHFKLNGKKVNIPSLSVRANDAIAVIDSSKSNTHIMSAVANVEKRGVPGWLELDPAKMTGKVAALPSREDVTMPMQEQLVVELYSK